MEKFSVFKNYEPGDPNCRIYVKNLAKQVQEKVGKQQNLNIYQKVFLAAFFLCLSFNCRILNSFLEDMWTSSQNWNEICKWLWYLVKSKLLPVYNTGENYDLKTSHFYFFPHSFLSASVFLWGKNASHQKYRNKKYFLHSFWRPHYFAFIFCLLNLLFIGWAMQNEYSADNSVYLFSLHTLYLLQLYTNVQSCNLMPLNSFSQSPMT